MNDWPHQVYGVNEVAQQRKLGHRLLCLTSPTGGGKTRMAQRMIEWGYRTVVYANRKMLIEQLSTRLSEAWIPHGIMAAGYAEEIGRDVQIASVQTVERRWTARRLHLHPAEIVVVDECHNEKGKRMREIIAAHIEDGATVVGITATPVGIGGIYKKLIQAGTISELRKCGALVPAITYAPDEVTSKAFKPKTMGIMQLKDEVKQVMLPTIFGRVIEHYRKLNATGKPAILFAPGVAESMWFAENFVESGISAAHIDGSKIWINGETVASTTDNRQRLRLASESGEVQIVCNRFVMREGVDWPHLAHCIFACTFGGICSYLQAGGRGLRNHPSLKSIIVQDHGGNYWRHGSLNEDRDWDIDDTERSIAVKASKAKAETKEDEPIVCPNCSKVRAHGVSCPSCGHVQSGRRRIVIQTDGTLREIKGPVPRKKVSSDPEDWKLWKACVFRCRNSGRTFSQARAIYAKENFGLYPASDFPLMPKDTATWQTKVADVNLRDLSSN